MDDISDVDFFLDELDRELALKRQESGKALVNDTFSSEEHGVVTVDDRPDDRPLLDDFEIANLKIAASRIAGVGEALDRAWDSFHARMTASKLGHCSKPIDRESMGVGALCDQMQVWLRAVEELKGVGIMLEDLPAYIDWLKERAIELGVRCEE